MFSFAGCRLPLDTRKYVGGLVGLIVGTHPVMNSYDPESRIVHMLTNPCWSLAHRGPRWRQAVYQWLHEIDAPTAVERVGLTVAEGQQDSNSNRIVYGGVVVECETGTHTQADNIFNFDDYNANLCWICQDSANNWDLWFSCHHAFCEKCSNEMLRRRMPCPLCRVRSSRVIRRKAIDHKAGDHKTVKAQQIPPPKQHSMGWRDDGL